MRIWPLFLFLLVVGSTSLAQSFAIYLAPGGNDQNTGTSPRHAFQSIEKAQAAVRQYRQQHPSDSVFVYFMEGEYAITKPLLFAPEDGGTADAPVIYTPYNDATVVWNGGKRISGWRKHKQNIWVADVPEVRTGGWSFKQLYVNGERRNRARLPKTGFYQVKGFPDGNLEKGYQTPSKRFEYSPGDIRPTWRNLQDVEVVVYHFWTDTHLTIDSVDEKKHIVSFRYPSRKIFTDDFNNTGARYIVENVFEGLQDPGDWYLDKKEGRLYYIPLGGEDMKTLSVWAPQTPAFIHINGDAEKRRWVTNLQFQGLRFQYANFQLPEGNVNNAQGSSSVAAAITLKGARQCTFQNCTITNSGGFAFDVGDGCAENTFSHNQLLNLSGGGLRMNGGTFKVHPLLQTHNNVISDNTIGRFGLDYPSAVGILLMHSHSNQVVHNRVYDGFYTGISVGWEWGYQRSISRDNLIAFNHIYNIGQGLLSDMGAIYTLGVSPGTVIRNNLIHDVDAHNYGGWGIYNDEGSSYILVENNIVYNTKFAPYNIHYAKEVTVRNNIFAFGRLQQLNRTRTEPHKSVYFENNIIYWHEGELLDGDWQDKPYSFYFNPMGKEGVQQVTSTFDMDYNIYFNPKLRLDSVKFNKLSFMEWQKRGKDIHSQFADPLFADVSQYNFTLPPNSPAIKSGFRPFDISSAGPRKRASEK